MQSLLAWLAAGVLALIGGGLLALFVRREMLIYRRVCRRRVRDEPRLPFLP